MGGKGKARESEITFKEASPGGKSTQYRPLFGFSTHGAEYSRLIENTGVNSKSAILVTVPGNLTQTRRVNRFLA